MSLNQGFGSNKNAWQSNISTNNLIANQIIPFTSIYDPLSQFNITTNKFTGKSKGYYLAYFLLATNTDPDITSPDIRLNDVVYSTVINDVIERIIFLNGSTDNISFYSGNIVTATAIANIFKLY